ncbi:hypothetical protein D3C71_1288360 [compost metagenome]
MANKTTSVSIANVIVLRLLTTRSYTSNMYTVGTKTSRPANTLSQRARQKNGVSFARACSSSDGAAVTDMR